MLVLILVLVVFFPLLWFVSEFQDRTWLRIVLGCGAIAVSFLVATGVGMLQQLTYNSSYGHASQQLIDMTLNELQANNHSGVVRNLEWLNDRFEPSYENRGNYDELVYAVCRAFRARRSSTLIAAMVDHGGEDAPARGEVRSLVLVRQNRVAAERVFVPLSVLC